MTLKPLPKWLAVAATKLLGYAFVPILFPIFGYLWLAEGYDRRFGPTPGTWQRWYAWLPTRLGRWAGKSGVVWLEPVERTRWGDMYLYRRPGDTSIRAEWEIEDEE